MAVYVGARDLAGNFAFIGTHQFLVIAPDPGSVPPVILPSGKTIFPRTLGNGKSGYIVGAQNRGRLLVEYFEKSDYLATLEHFNPNKHRKWYKADLDAELALVKHNNNDSIFIRKLFFLINNYIINEREDNIPYPFSGLAVNSNSWAQSVIAAANGKVIEDLKGLDIFHNKRIPAIYFQAICPATPRPKVNQ